MPVSYIIREKWVELADKLDAIEQACIARDEYEAELHDPPSNPNIYTPCTPFYNELLGYIEEWWAYDREDRKKDISSMYKYAFRVIGLKDEYLKSMEREGVKVRPAFYTTHDALKNGLSASFDEVFNASGFWEELFSRPDTYYANDNAETLVTTDNTTYFTGDYIGGTSREWRRAQDERDRLLTLVGNHTDEVRSKDDEELDALLEKDIPYTTGLNRY